MDLLREVAEPSKRQILSLLRSGPKSVSDLVDATGMKQPNVSNHLSRLKSKGIVKADKVGRQVFYSIITAEVAESLSGILNDDDSLPVSETVTLDEELVRKFAKATTTGNEAEATAIVDHLLRQNVRPLDIYEMLFGYSLALIGQWWEVKAIDVGQEHLASATIERLMSRVVHHVPPMKSTALVALLGCVQGNWHSLGIRMVSDVVRMQGWRTFYLGANVPHESFVSAIEEHKPHMVMASCPMEDCKEETLNLLEHLQAYRRSHPGFLIVMGGSYVSQNPELFKAHGVDYIGSDLGDVAERMLPEIEARLRKGAESQMN